MYIKVDHKEVVSLTDFKLGEIWVDKINSKLSNEEKRKVRPFSELESKRLNKVVDYFEIESNLRESYIPTDWMTASRENNDRINQFRDQLGLNLKGFDEDLIICWNRKLALKTTKEIFIKYWDQFLYHESYRITVISENTNWVIFYDPIEVANIWIKTI